MDRKPCALTLCIKVKLPATVFLLQEILQQSFQVFVKRWTLTHINAIIYGIMDYF